MFEIIKEHIRSRKQILYLAKADLVKTYRGAALGWLWALVQPLTLLLVYWFVLHIGLKIDITYGEADFFSWLMVGLAAWLFISDTLHKGTGSIRAYKYLVSKMKFPVSTIPTFVTLSKMFVHLVILGIVLIVLVLNGVKPSVYWLQLPLYIALMMLLFAAWSLFAAPLAAISKDFVNLVKSATRILFWLSGILWSVSALNIEWIRTVLLFNPVTFFVEGYRKSLVYGEWFFEDRTALAAFGLVFAIMITLAVTIYKRARKEIVDAL